VEPGVGDDVVLHLLAFHEDASPAGALQIGWYYHHYHLSNDFG
jgi:hypothetical protein